MVEQRLDATFRALADPTRRGMLASLALGVGIALAAAPSVAEMFRPPFVNANTEEQRLMKQTRCLAASDDG